MRILLLSLLLLSFALPVCASPIKGTTVFQAINEERKGSHLRPLAPDAALVRLAQQKADDMERRGYFAHSDPDGRSIMRTYFFSKENRFTSMGENLAWRFSSTEPLVAAWMKSPTHRGNILERSYTKTGIGISKSGRYVVQYFGR